MGVPRKTRFSRGVVLSAGVFVALCFGIGLGVALAQSRNLDLSLDAKGPTSVLPTRVLDRNGRLIMQFYGPEKRQVVALGELPKYLIYAVITREDKNFYHHHGFSIRGTLRAAWNILAGEYVSGGSTITQQLAGTLYADRSERTLLRKIKELWFAVQLERRLTKDQILEQYLNTAYFGRNTYGIEAASRYYFGHSARELTLAESAMLAIQLANPARYYPYKYPNRARTMQHVVLQEMVSKGYVRQSEVDRSFAEYWHNYDYTRPASRSAGIDEESAAPYFTDYVRQQLEELLYGKLDYLRDGLTVHTTLNLDFQNTAQSMMQDAIKGYNAVYQRESSAVYADVNRSFVPVVDLLSYGFDLRGLAEIGTRRAAQDAVQSYLAEINPSLDVLSLMFDLTDLQELAAQAHDVKREKAEKTTVEGALVTLDNHTGEILAMVGGYDYSTSQFNRAVDARVQPGSSFKPLYYAEAISSRKFTAASRIFDGPVVFYAAQGEPYRPYNFLGQWQGSVLLWYALADSINVPSLQVLDGIGFDAAVERAARLLGFEGSKNDPKVFPHVFPLGLGITPVAPLDMARAYAIFANSGREVDPVAIKYIQDRAGTIILEPEKDLMADQKRRGNGLQVLSPQAAYVMVSLLENVVSAGTLKWAGGQAGWFDGMPMAGKTGTTQNWSDAWTIGFSPYYTSAIWFGFDQRGGSLGLNLTGATAAGPVWARYMRSINTGLPRIDFPRPESGLVNVRVDAESGLLPTNDSKGTVDLVFLAGTEPRKFNDLGSYTQERADALIQKLQSSDLIQGHSSAAGTTESFDGAGPWSEPSDSGPVEAGHSNPLLD